MDDQKDATPIKKKVKRKPTPIKKKVKGKVKRSSKKAPKIKEDVATVSESVKPGELNKNRPEIKRNEFIGRRETGVLAQNQRELRGGRMGDPLAPIFGLKTPKQQALAGKVFSRQFSLFLLIFAGAIGIVGILHGVGVIDLTALVNEDKDVVPVKPTDPNGDEVKTEEKGFLEENYLNILIIVSGVFVAGGAAYYVFYKSNGYTMYFRTAANAVKTFAVPVAICIPALIIQQAFGSNLMSQILFVLAGVLLLWELVKVRVFKTGNDLLEKTKEAQEYVKEKASSVTGYVSSFYYEAKYGKNYELYFDMINEGVPADIAEKILTSYDNIYLDAANVAQEEYQGRTIGEYTDEHYTTSNNKNKHFSNEEQLKSSKDKAYNSITLHHIKTNRK